MIITIVRTFQCQVGCRPLYNGYGDRLPTLYRNTVNGKIDDLIKRSFFFAGCENINKFKHICIVIWLYNVIFIDNCTKLSYNDNYISNFDLHTLLCYSTLQPHVQGGLVMQDLMRKGHKDTQCCIKKGHRGVIVGSRDLGLSGMGPSDCNGGVRWEYRERGVGLPAWGQHRLITSNYTLIWTCPRRLPV